MSDKSYGLRTELSIPYDQAVDKVTVALKNEGFGILTEIDVKSTLRKKVGRRLSALRDPGSVQPAPGYRALQAELDVGLLLPCNVIVYQEGEGAVVSIIDPLTMVGVSDNPALGKVAQEARAKLQRVVDKLKQWATLRI